MHMEAHCKAYRKAIQETYQKYEIDEDSAAASPLPNNL